MERPTSQAMGGGHRQGCLTQFDRMKTASFAALTEERGLRTNCSDEAAISAFRL
jgi:hypothetical protein